MTTVPSAAARYSEPVCGQARLVQTCSKRCSMENFVYKNIRRRQRVERRRRRSTGSLFELMQDNSSIAELNNTVTMPRTTENLTSDSIASRQRIQLQPQHYSGSLLDTVPEDSEVLELDNLNEKASPVRRPSLAFDRCQFSRLTFTGVRCLRAKGIDDEPIYEAYGQFGTTHEEEEEDVYGLLVSTSIQRSKMV